MNDSYSHVVTMEGISLFQSTSFSNCMVKARCLRLRGIPCYVCSDAAFDAFGGGS